VDRAHPLVRRLFRRHPPMKAATDKSTPACITMVATAAILLAAACDRTPHSPRSPAGVARRFARPLGDTVWTALLSDSAAGNADVIVSDDRAVYVSDGIHGNVVALDAATGARRWETRRSSDSTVAHLAPRLITPRRHGGIFAVDADGSSVLELSPDGRLARRLVFESSRHVETVCELPDARLLVSMQLANGTLLTTSDAGRILDAQPLPWSDLQRTSGLLSAVRLAPTRDGCLAALLYGRGFASFDGSHFGPALPYVEPVALPEVREQRRTTVDGFVVSTYLADHVGGAMDLAVTPSAIVTSFGGHSDDRNHLVDVYDLQGRYLESYRTRRAVSALTANDSLLYILTHRAGEPIVVALRWKRSDVPRTASTR
jgi:hypothetical protein